MSVDTILPPYPASSFSSPPSSPNPFTDSSPASSPDIASTYDPDDDVPEITLPHPLAASTNSGWRPPQYEKKRPMLSVSPPPPEHRTKKPKHASFDPHPYLEILPPSSPISPTFPHTPEQLENAKWDAAASGVFDNSHGVVNLDNENLTTIPLSFIEDVDKFYTPPNDDEILSSVSPRAEGGNRLARTATAPPGQILSGSRIFSRTRSAANTSFGVPKDRIQLHLSNNFIQSLPLALFRLENLSVLALRSNKLTYLPPEINQLKHLHTLNVSNNRLQYLPSELLQMNLSQLLVNLNPFIAPPLSPNGLALARPVSEPMYSPSRIPPLTELCLRALLSPSKKSYKETVLETHYDLPLDECPPDPLELPLLPNKTRCNAPVPFHIRQVLHSACSWSVDFQEGASTLETGVGTCPSPHHQGHQAMGTGVFVRLAVERFTWERIVAGVTVGGLVPIKWRGCLRHCLDFLDPPLSPKPEPSIGSSTTTVEEDWSMDTDEVVHVVDLAVTTFDDEEGFNI